MVSALHFTSSPVHKQQTDDEGTNGDMKSDGHENHDHDGHGHSHGNSDGRARSGSGAKAAPSSTSSTSSSSSSNAAPKQATPTPAPAAAPATASSAPKAESSAASGGLQCGDCHQMRPADHYSAAQLKKKGKRRCRTCVGDEH
jgi:cell division protein FtsN